MLSGINRTTFLVEDERDFLRDDAMTTPWPVDARLISRRSACQASRLARPRLRISAVIGPILASPNSPHHIKWAL